MRYVNIDNIVPGDILAKDVVDNRGNVLLRASSEMILKENMIIRLKEKGVLGLYVSDELSKGIEIEDAIPVTVRNLAIQALEKKNVQQTELIAKEIVSTFKSNVEIDLNRMMNGISYYERALNICELCMSLGTRLNYSKDSLNKLVASALLSDIGLIMTDEEKEEILNQELANLKQILLKLPVSEIYPILGRFVVSNAKADAMVVHSVYFHKENEDGTGLVQDFYKQLGINNNCDIRDTAKIIHICSDYIDCLINENDLEKARHLIQKGILDKKYNYDLASTFLRFIPIYPIGTIVNLSSGEKGVVVSNNDGNPTLPIVQLEDGRRVDLTETLNMVIEGIDNQTNIRHKVA